MEGEGQASEGKEEPIFGNKIISFLFSLFLEVRYIFTEKESPARQMKEKEKKRDTNRLSDLR